MPANCSYAWSWAMGLELVIVSFILCSVLSSQIPSAQCRHLDETLDDTGTFLESVIERGLLVGSDVGEAQQALASMQAQAVDLKLCSHCAPSMVPQVKGLLGGLSYSIYRLRRRVELLRARIARRASDELRRLKNEGGPQRKTHGSRSHHSSVSLNRGAHIHIALRQNHGPPCCREGESMSVLVVDVGVFFACGIWTTSGRPCVLLGSGLAM
ncbi:uncharacterized protein B0H18DRAFT_527860 [Fomitopsis serialis]|uniref:uncharacterized protein n=1 Tax=Fomitopsis serialis TaxID=139415 RepID=UPI002007FBB1|nr:uncharacterized protein B0H18DRAFT_527860 [Neoantrodia serialis]KAH9922123.1 hypothetical protein B0H18DRAFT_527860 [Neoantrodia serialis]